MIAYYNEFDPFAAEWLRHLITTGAIPRGVVDERSISEVKPKDLEGYRQCHFFAGVGVWAYVLQQANWGDRPVWTGSCPCQPFSSAGKRKGIKDDRHLWPEYFRLIRACQPSTVFGEQVASKDGLAWLSLVHSDLDREGYDVGAAGTVAAGFGAPHIRQRLYFCGLGNTRQGGQLQEEGRHRGAHRKSGKTGKLADAAGSGLEGSTRASVRSTGSRPSVNSGVGGGGAAKAPEGKGFWRDSEWLPFRDGKRRPVEPGSFPLVNGAPNRVGRLRGYGNALCAPQAQAFVASILERISL